MANYILVYIYSDAIVHGGISITQAPYGIRPTTGTTNKQIDLSFTLYRPAPTQYWDFDDFNFYAPPIYFGNNFVYTPTDGFPATDSGSLNSTLAFNSASSHVLCYAAGVSVHLDHIPDDLSEHQFFYYGNGALSDRVRLPDNVQANGGVIADSITFVSLKYQVNTTIMAGTFSGTFTRARITAKLAQETIEANFGVQSGGIFSGQTATLYVQGDFIQTISIDQGIGPVSNARLVAPTLFGTVLVSPTVTTTYTITGHGPARQDVTTTITLIVFDGVGARRSSTGDEMDMAQDHSSGHITIIKSVPAP